MRAEDLMGWLAAARRGKKERETATKDGGAGREHGERRMDKTADEENWARVVELIQTAFRDGDMAEESTWKHM